LKVDDDKTGQNMINNSINQYAKENSDYLTHHGKDKSIKDLISHHHLRYNLKSNP